MAIASALPQKAVDLLQCASWQRRATKRRKSRKIRDSEADISRPGNKNCGCAHEVAGDDQQERMPAVDYRYTSNSHFGDFAMAAVGAGLFRRGFEADGSMRGRGCRR